MSNQNCFIHGTACSESCVAFVPGEGCIFIIYVSRLDDKLSQINTNLRNIESSLDYLEDIEDLRKTVEKIIEKMR